MLPMKSSFCLLCFTGLSKDSSLSPVRDGAFLPKQCFALLFVISQGVARCEWHANFISWRKVAYDLACLCFLFCWGFFLCMFVLFDAFDNVPLTEIAGLSFTHVHGCYFLQMTAFLKS